MATYENVGPENLGIGYLLSAYASGSLTPVNVVHAVYDRVDACADKAVWIVLVPRADAIARAQALCTKYGSDGDERPPLFCIPFSVKDSIDIAGFETTLACPSYAYRASRTATVVQKCLDAGGILIGKTNLDQFATGLVGHRSPYGTPRCVFDRDYISGGSSSGGAVSVAAGLVSFAVGTDTAGSTRVPAALNGLVGWKPTIGTVSTVGLVPAVQTADCVTVLARTVDDAEAAWSVMKGFDPEDVFARRQLPEWPWPWPWPAKGEAAGDEPVVRFGVPPDDLLLSVLSPHYARLYKATIETIAAAPGFVQATSGFDYAPFQSANDLLYGSSIVAQRLVAFDDYIQAHGLEQLHPAIRAIFSASMPPAAGWDAVRAYKDLFALQADRRRAELQFERHIDVLVVPSTATHFTVAEIDEDPLGRNRLLGSFAHFVNLLDLCAVAIPTADTWTNKNGNAMPFGITLIAQAGRDKELLALARRIQALAK